VLVFLAHSSATSQSFDLGVNGAFKSILNTHWKVKKDKSLEEKRVRLLSINMMCLASALTLLWILKGFSKTGIFPFSLEALLNSELVIDPLTHIDPPLPKKKKCEHGISRRLLIGTCYLQIVVDCFIASLVCFYALSNYLVNVSTVTVK
jgi:hypothetical protein